MFRYKAGVKVSYARQGYIYFISLRFAELKDRQKEKIWKLCRRCGGENSEALFAAVTTETSDDLLCCKYFISKSTLYRMKRKYYEEFPKDL